MTYDQGQVLIQEMTLARQRLEINTGHMRGANSSAFVLITFVVLICILLIAKMVRR